MIYEITVVLINGDRYSAGRTTEDGISYYVSNCIESGFVIMMDLDRRVITGAVPFDKVLMFEFAPFTEGSSHTEVK